MKKIASIAALLLVTSCSSPVANAPIKAFAPCSSIQTRGMSADGIFLECLDGLGEVAIGSIEGPAVITVWASWCSNCESQRPNMIRLFHESKGRFQVIGVDAEERKKEDGLKHALKKGMSYPQLFDPDGRSVSTFGPGVPITQFIDSSNRLVYTQLGAVREYKDLTGLVEKYLGIKL